jgi:hypothetical protein
MILPFLLLIPVIPSASTGMLLSALVDFHHTVPIGFQIVIEQFWLLRNYAISHKHL